MGIQLHGDLHATVFRELDCVANEVYQDLP